MLKLILEDNWIKIEGRTTKQFVQQLKAMILPDSYRRFDYETSNWYVHKDREATLLNLTKKHFGTKFELVNFQVAQDTPYSVLFVTQDAPDLVVKASYKVLSTIYHPDKGGSLEQMSKLNQAYDLIKKIRGLL